MRVVMLVLAVCLMTAPATASVPAIEDPFSDPPEMWLNHDLRTTAIHWEHQNNKTVTQIEVWRHDAAHDGGWILLGNAPINETTHVDARRPETTTYGLAVFYDDGTFTRVAGDADETWPRCDWLILTLPPHIREWCLFPPPEVVGPVRDGMASG